MPHHIWFENTPLKHNARHRKVDADKKLANNGGASRGSPSVPSYKVITKAASSKVRFGNYITALYNLSDIAQIYDLAPSTVSRWYAKGMLPEPFTCNKGQRCWGNTVPYYTKSQVLVICIVLDDLFRQQSRQFRQDHIQHIEMMRVGCIIARERIAEKARFK